VTLKCSWIRFEGFWPLPLASDSSNASVAADQSRRALATLTPNRRRVDKFCTHVSPKAPDYSVPATLGWFVRSEKQRKVIGDLEAMRMKSNAAIGITEAAIAEWFWGLGPYRASRL
jgi:hypothetical protein